MDDKSVRTIAVYLSESDKELLSGIAKKQHLSLSELFRRCTLYTFQDMTARVRGDDCYIFMNYISDVRKTCERISEETSKYGIIYLNETEKMFLLAKEIDICSYNLYTHMDKIRSRIKKYVLKKALSQQKAFVENRRMKGKRTTFQITVTAEEKEVIRQKAEAEGQSISALLRDNVLRQCAIKNIYVDSYPLDILNENLLKETNLLKAIEAKISEQGTEPEDMENIIECLNSINELVKNFIIPEEQKETRKEATRILKEV